MILDNKQCNLRDSRVSINVEDGLLTDVLGNFLTNFLDESKNESIPRGAQAQIERGGGGNQEKN